MKTFKIKLSDGDLRKIKENLMGFAEAYCDEEMASVDKANNEELIEKQLGFVDLGMNGFEKLKIEVKQV